MKQIKSIIAVMALTLTAALVSCSSEAVKEVANGIGGGGKSNVVTFQLGNGNKSTTRAEAEDYSTGVPVGSVAGFDRENAINFDKLYVVVFKLNADGKTYSWYKTFKKNGTDGTALTKTAGATAADDKFQFDMGDGGVYYMYVIANTEVDLTTQTITDRESLYQIIDQLDKSAYVSGGTSKLNEVTDLLMTSNQIQVNIKGDEETVLDPITLTRAIARIDINASAMPDNFRIDKVKFKNRYNKTYLIRGTKGEAMTDASLTKDDSNTPKEYAKDDVKIDVTPATPGPPATPAVSNYEGTFDNVWNGVIYACENYDVTDGGRTKLIVEGTYTSGDHNGITVSHEIDFGTMKIQRNYLYQVRLALEDPAPDTYGKVTHAINVKDWTSGVTLAWAGDENLYNNSQEPNFVVTDALKLTADGAPLQKYCIKKFDDATLVSTFYVESTSTKSGLSLTCSAQALPATAAEIAANSGAGDYQCKITPMESTYDENGEFTQKWEVVLRRSAFADDNDLTFYLRNALNADKSASFEVTDNQNYYKGIAIGDIIYEDGSWTHETADVATKISAGHTPVAIVFATKDDITIPDYDKGKGFTNGYAMALKENGARYLWASPELTSFIGSGIEAVESLPLTHFNEVRRDYNGLEHCDQIQTAIDAGTYTLNRLPAYKRAKEYTAVGGETLANTTSGWFLPSIGQAYRWYVEFGGKVDNDSYSVVYRSNNNNYRICFYWSNGGATYGTAINNYLTAKVGNGRFTPFVYGNQAEPGWYTTSTQYHHGNNVYNCMILDLSWSNGNAGGNTNGHLSSDYITNKTYRVRPIIAL